MTQAGARRALVHTALFYAAMFGALGAHLPFWPVWLEDWGLTPGEVGAYLSLGIVTRIGAGLAVPVIADRLGRRRSAMLLLCATGAALFLAHLFIGTRAVLLAATLGTGAVISGIMPLGEALGAGAVRRFGFSYSLARSLGSVAFLVANLAVGAMIARFGANAALWWIVACLAAGAALGRTHPGGGVMAGAAPPGFGEIWALLTQPTFALFTAAAAMSLSSHAVLYAYGSVHWRALGIPGGTIGALWAFSVAVETVVMLTLGRRAIERIGPLGALSLSGAGGLVRWGAMMADPPLAWLWGLQALHSLTFVAGHLGAMAFVVQAVPDRYGGSAQGAYMGLGGGILTAAAMGLSALVYPWAGGLTYGIALAMSGAGLLLTLRLRARWDGGTLAV